MNTELITALDILEKEKKISKKVLIEAIENSLLAACKNHFGKNENFTAKVDTKTGDFKVTAAKEVVETVEDSVTQISLADAQMISPKYNIGDTINVEIKSAEFGRIAVQNSKSAILQKIREEERQAVYNEYHAKEKDIVTGIVSRYAGNNLVINLGRADAILSEADMVKGEKYKPNDRIKVYVTEVKTEKKGLKIAVSRCHPEFVKRLFEAEVAELRDGTVEIRSIAREAGSRTKMAVRAKVPNVDTAGKTGTTNLNKDGWFCGYTPYYTTAVWVGRDDNRIMESLSGASYPKSIWSNFMNAIHSEYSSTDSMGGNYRDYQGETTQQTGTQATTATESSTKGTEATTAAPTTAAPTTAAPTTAAPTTAAPQTEEQPTENQ